MSFLIQEYWVRDFLDRQNFLRRILFMVLWDNNQIIIIPFCVDQAVWFSTRYGG